jgi:hypothetical protein
MYVLINIYQLYMHKKRERERESERERGREGERERETKKSEGKPPFKAKEQLAQKKKGISLSHFALNNKQQQLLQLPK